MPSDHTGSRLSRAQTNCETQKSRDQRDLLDRDIHLLEARLGSPTPGRQHEWLAKVVQATAGLIQSLQASVSFGSKLLRDVEFAAPHLWAEAKRIQKNYAELERETVFLRERLDSYGDGKTAEVNDIRERLTSFLRALRKLQARENDLIFEVYHRDIGVGD